MYIYNNMLLYIGSSEVHYIYKQLTRVYPNDTPMNDKRREMTTTVTNTSKRNDYNPDKYELDHSEVTT